MEFHLDGEARNNHFFWTLPNKIKFYLFYKVNFGVSCTDVNGSPFSFTMPHVSPNFGVRILLFLLESGLHGMALLKCEAHGVQF